MPTFLYRAVELDGGQVVEGTLEAIDDRQARALLRARGVTPLALAAAAAAPGDVAAGLAPLLEQLSFRAPRHEDLAVFVRQLAAILEAGMPLVEGLALLEPQTPSPSLQEATATVRKELLAGAGFADALGHHPRVFPPLMIHLARAGELAGELDSMLARLAEMLEKQVELERKITAALTYPAVVAAVLFGVVILMLAFVVPTFAAIFHKAHEALPFPTQVLIGTSNLVRGAGVWLFPLALALVFGYRAYRRSPTGKPQIDRFWLRVPGIGRLLLERDANTFVRAFAVVYGAGVPITSALATCRGLVQNAAVRDLLDRAELAVRSGQPLAEQLQGSQYFPPVLAQMMFIGESTGRLEELSLKAVSFSDREIDHRVKQLTTMLEPALTVVMGMIVAFVALALYGPMFDLPRILSH